MGAGKKKGLGRYRVLGKWAALGFVAAGVAAVCLLASAATRVVQTVAEPVRRPIYSVETEENLVALGINCAWGNEDIEQILEVLGHYNVKASFFVVGDWCDRYPQSVRRIHEAGHEVGSHSDTHADMTKLDRAGILREIRDSSRKIEALTGKKPTLFRPPSGAYDNESIRLIEEEGLYPIQWDCDSLDYRDLTADQMWRRISKSLRRGSILLFHSGTQNTAAALPRVIEAIRAEGYEFTPVSELIHPWPYTVDFQGRQHAVDRS